MFQKISVVMSRVNSIALWLLFWGTVFFSLYNGYKYMYPIEIQRIPYVARIDIYGEIVAGITDHLKVKIDEAYNDPNAKAVIFHIDSSGGVPAEAWRLCEYISGKKIADLEKNEKERRHTFATIGVSGTSAAFYIGACIGNVYAAPGSNVGSVGSVIYFNEEDQKTIKHIASGSGKVFNPNDKEGRKLAEELVTETAKDFLVDILAFRDGKLKVSVDEIATGRMWTGKRAAELGLIDGLSTPEAISRNLKIPLLYPGIVEPTNWDKAKDVLSVLKQQK